VLGVKNGTHFADAPSKLIEIGLQNGYAIPGTNENALRPAWTKIFAEFSTQGVFFVRFKGTHWNAPLAIAKI
jgi:hypothetical protein